MSGSVFSVEYGDSVVHAQWCKIAYTKCQVKSIYSTGHETSETTFSQGQGEVSSCHSPCLACLRVCSARPGAWLFRSPLLNLFLGCRPAVLNSVFKNLFYKILSKPVMSDSSWGVALRAVHSFDPRGTLSRCWGLAPWSILSRSGSDGFTA